MGKLNIENFVRVVKAYGLNTKKAVDFSQSPSVALPSNTTVNGSAIGSGGAAAATFTVAGTTKQRIYNTYDYGATGDGTTDDTAAINAAIVAANAAGGGTVLLPRSNTVKINTASGITPMNTVNIQGHGRGVTTLLPYGTNSAIKLFGSTGAPLTDVTFSDFTIDGANQSGSYTSAIKGIYITYMVRCNFERIHAKNTGATSFGNDFHQDCFYIDCIAENGGRLGTTGSPGAAGIGIGVSSWDTGAKFIGCVTRNNKRAGIFFESQDTTRATNYMVIGHTSEGNEFGIGDAGCDGLQVIGGVFRNNTKAGVTSYTGTIGQGRIGTNGLYMGLDVYGNATSGYVASDSGGGNRFINCKFYNNTQHGMSFAITTDVVYLSIKDCDIYLNQNAGINLGSGTGSWSKFSITGNRIFNNGLSGTSAAGILITGNVSGGMISDNMCFDDQGTKKQLYGIQITGGTIAGGNLAILNNDLRANATGPYSNTGGTMGAAVAFMNNLGMDAPAQKSADYTVDVSDRGCTIPASGTTTITLPTAASKAGFSVTILKTDATNTLTVATTSSQTINGSTTYAMTVQYKFVTVISNGSNWLITGSN